MARRVRGEKRYLAGIQRPQTPLEGFPAGLKELDPGALSVPQPDGASVRTHERPLRFDEAGSLAAAVLRQLPGKRP